VAEGAPAAQAAPATQRAERAAAPTPTPKQPAARKPAGAKSSAKPRKAAGTARTPSATARKPSATARKPAAPPRSPRKPPQPAGTPPTAPASRRPPNGADIIGTAVQAAAEIAEIGLSAGARALRSAVSKLPRP
jgi:hypothetical protein